MKEHSISIDGKPGMMMKASKLLWRYQLKSFLRSKTFKLLLVIFFIGIVTVPVISIFAAFTLIFLVFLARIYLYFEYKKISLENALIDYSTPYFLKYNELGLYHSSSSFKSPFHHWVDFEKFIEFQAHGILLLRNKITKGDHFFFECEMQPQEYNSFLSVVKSKLPKGVIL